MIRTQVYLPKDLYYHIDQVARREKKAKAQVIREVLDEGIRKKRPNASDALLRLAKLGEKLKVRGPKDLSTNLDKYLYEDE